MWQGRLITALAHSCFCSIWLNLSVSDWVEQYSNVELCFSIFLFNSYKTAIQGLGIDEQHVVKLVPNRIFSLTFHPAKYKTLLFAGDKWGNLGVWDVVRILIIKSEEFFISYFVFNWPTSHDLPLWIHNAFSVIIEESAIIFQVKSWEATTLSKLTLHDTRAYNRNSIKTQSM